MLAVTNVAVPLLAPVGSGAALLALGRRLPSALAGRAAPQPARAA